MLKALFHLLFVHAVRVWFKILIITSLITFSAVSSLRSQPNTEEQIAIQYFQNKEFDKAAALFENIYNSKPTPFIYNYYLNSLIELKDFKKAEKFLNRILKKNPGNNFALVDLGYIYALAGEQDKANKQYDATIKSIIPDQEKITMLANAFMVRNLYTYAIKTYETGKKILKNQAGFQLEMAEIYLKTNDYSSAFMQFFDYAEKTPENLEVIQNKLQDLLIDDPDNTKNTQFKTQLLQLIKKNPDVKPYSTLLYWYFIQQKEFPSAVTQAIAMDKRFAEDGSRLVMLARIAASNMAYDEAIECFDYIISKKGVYSAFYETSIIEKINTRFLKITSTSVINQEEIISLEKEYYDLLSKQTENNSALQLIINLAHLQAFYLDKKTIAIELLQKALTFKNVSSELLSQSKLKLGDIYLLTGNVWEASLLYMQVEKAFKNDVTGFDAKFRNAKLYYYINEFEFSKGQLDVLKTSTAKLIANDAMELSLLISDNIDDDSTFTGLGIFARADLLLFQNKDEQALKTLDSINTIALYHPLFDDVLLKKAKIKIRNQRFLEADSLLSKLIKNYMSDILADDALYLLGEINEKHIKNTHRAMDFYYQLITDFPGSVYAVDARNRYRILRGDKIN